MVVLVRAARRTELARLVLDAPAQQVGQRLDRRERQMGERIARTATPVLQAQHDRVHGLYQHALLAPAAPDQFDPQA